MLNRIITLRSAVIAVVLAFSLGMGTLLVATPASASAATSWNYQILTFDAGKGLNTLKTQGKDGWEIASATAIGGKIQIILKRPS